MSDEIKIKRGTVRKKRVEQLEEEVGLDEEKKLDESQVLDEPVFPDIKTSDGKVIKHKAFPDLPEGTDGTSEVKHSEFIELDEEQFAKLEDTFKPDIEDKLKETFKSSDDEPKKKRRSKEVEEVLTKLMDNSENEELLQKRAEIIAKRNRIIVPTEDDEQPSENINILRTSDSILKFQFEVSDVLIDDDMDKLLHIPSFKDLNPIIIGNVLAESAKLEARWNAIYNEAAAAYELKELEIDIWKAQKDCEIRQEAVIMQEKLTEGKIANMIICDPEYKKLHTELIDMKRKANNVKGSATAFISRGNKAANLSSLVKAEMNMSGSI